MAEKNGSRPTLRGELTERLEQFEADMAAIADALQEGLRADCEREDRALRRDLTTLENVVTDTLWNRGLLGRLRWLITGR